MLNLVWVRTFAALVKRKSFQGAADKLGIAQPTVTQHIQKLEEQLGVVLFCRGRNGCEPTREAVAFLPYAESLLRINDRAVAAIARDCVRVGASSNIGTYLLQPYVNAYLKGRDPGHFDMVIACNPSIADMLENSEIDVAVMEWWDGRNGFQSAPWRREDIVVIVPPDHPLSSRSSVSKIELSRQELLGGEPGTGTGRMLARFFGGDTPMPKISMQLGSTEAVKQAVRAGLGISMVFKSAVQPEVELGHLVAIPFADEPLQKELFVIWRDQRNSKLSPPAFVDYLLAPDHPVPAMTAFPADIGMAVPGE